MPTTKHLLSSCALLALFAATTTAQQNQPPAPPAATATAAPAAPASTASTANHPRGYIAVMRVTGEAYVFEAGDTLRFALRAGSLVNAGQQIATGPKANVMLAFSNGATVTIGENAIIAVDEFTQTPFAEMFKMAEASKEPSASKTRLNLVRGEVLANVKKLNTDEGSTFEVKTSIGIAGIRGTTFEISYYPPAPKRDRNAAPPAAPTAGNATPAFALIMLEGTIAMRVPGKNQPIIVPEGKELVLDGSNIDPATGALAATTDADTLSPAATSVATQATLLQGAQTMMAAASAITMPSSASLSGLTTEMPADMLAPATAPDAKSPPPAASENASAPFPAPDAHPPAPRLSPTDGTGAQ